MKIVSLRLAVIMISVAFAIIPVVAQEVPDHVVISEVYANEVDAGSEWIELYNPTNANADIGGWVIDTKTDTSADATLPSGATIPTHGFYFIGDETGGSWYPDNSSWVTPDYTETITLTDDDGWVRLRKSEG